MTKKMNRMKHSVMKNGRRSLAMLLGIVMLITAIGSGSVLSTLAETVTAGVLSTEALENADAAAQEIAEDAANLTDGEQYENLESVFGSDEVSLAAKADLAGTGANADLASTGAWATDGKNAIYMKGPGETSFTQYAKTDTNGKMTFTLNTTGYYEWYLQADYGGSKTFRLKGGDPQPSGAMGDATNYYGKLSTGYSGGTGGENYYTNLPAGEYTIQYNGNWDNGKQIEYTFTRKVVQIQGNLTGSWSDTLLDMSYDSTSTNYYYEVTGDADRFYKFKVDTNMHYAYTDGYDLVDGGKNSYSNAYDAKTESTYSGNAFKVKAAANTAYKIWVKNQYTWVTSEAVSSDTYTIVGAYGTSGSSAAGIFTNAWSVSETANDMTPKSGGIYEKTYSVTSTDAGTIYFKIVLNHAYANGSWPSSNQTFKINSDSTWVKFSFDSSTHVITVTQDGTGGSSSSGDWIAGDKYTSSGTNASQKVSNTPNIGSTPAYSYVWADNDNGPGKDSNTAIATYANGTSGSIGYWADITTELASCKSNNKDFFFALANAAPASNPNNGNIRGNKNEQINCAVPPSGSTTSAGNNVEMYSSNGELVLTAARQERNDVSSSAYYIKITYYNTDVISNVAVMAYYNNSKVDYQFYFKEKDTGSNIETVEKVNIYAKNGALRDNTFNRFTHLADTKILGDDSSYTETGVFSFTEVTGDGVKTYDTIKAYNDDHSGSEIAITHNISSNGSDYDKITNVPVGAKIKLQTTLSDATTGTYDGGEKNISDIIFDGKNFRTTHYLKAYSFNGKTYQVHSYSDAGVYTEEWTVESVNTAKMKSESGNKVIEVTPIYYMKDASNCKTFYIDGYDGTVQGKWGNMLSVYPYYEGKSNRANAFGGYPGQPMLFWGGKFQMQIPLTSDGTASGAAVKGLTLHNAYWDLLHRSLDTQCNSSNHCQTYDYDDFYKLNKEKNPDTIIFDFKYETTKNNFDDGYDYTNYTFGGTVNSTTATAATYNGSGYNGVELLTDYFGRQVDVFGNLITSNASTWNTTPTQSNELLIVSNGYKDTYVGEYGTIWAVYAPSNVPTGCSDTANSFIGYISSSMLYLSSLSRVSQYTGGTNTADGRMSWTGFTDTYTHLENYYKGVPALISYEEEIWNDSKDKANRSDGRWYYSNKNDQISANIKIQYGPASNLNATVDAGTWMDDTFGTTGDDAKYKGAGGEYNIGKTTLCSAFFTNTSPYLYGKTASGTQFADSSKKFTFEAQANGAYMFAGWVRYSNGKYYEISAKEVAESDMSSNDVYIARFVEAETGSLSIQHIVERTGTYTGSGTPRLTVLVMNGNTTVVNQTVTDGSKIDISKYINTRYRGYTIDISLSTTPDDDCTLAEITSSVGNFSPGAISSNAATVAQFTVQNVIDSGATTLRYVSHLTLATITYNYSVTYNYTSRFYGDQRYTVTGTLLSSNPEQMTYISGSKENAKLTTDFLINHTPYEKNFRQKIAWDHGNADQSTTGSDTTYTITATVGSSNTVDDRTRAEFMLPYSYDTKANGYAAKKIDVFATAEDTTSNGSAEYVYDDKSYESVPITGQAYKLFTYDGSVVTGGSGTHASDMPLIEAAPYVYKSVGDNNVVMHQKVEIKKRYLNAGVVTENDTNYYYFTYNNVRYFYNVLPPTHEGTDVALTDSSQYQFHSEIDNTTYHYALNPSECTYPDNEDNNIARDAIYYWDLGSGGEGQYCVKHLHYVNDGVVAGTGVKKYFTRWDIFNSDGGYVASTYFRKFNYTGYEDYTVIPVYESDSDTFVEGTETSANKVPTITFIGDTRNQWNNNGGGSQSAANGDKLLTDFAISFDYYPDEIDLIPNVATDSTNGKDIRIGMMIEQLGTLDAVGTKKITDSSHYADKYKSSYTLETIASVENALKTGTNPKTITGANAIANVKIAANVEGWGRLFTDTSGNIGNDHSGLKPIDNYNRLQWYYTFNNIVPGTNNATTDKDYVYRASAYLIEVDANGNKTVTLSKTPVYFTLYDIASRQLGELD